jgi:hypothetical protein
LENSIVCDHVIDWVAFGHNVTERYGVAEWQLKYVSDLNSSPHTNLLKQSQRSAGREIFLAAHAIYYIL